MKQPTSVPRRLNRTEALHEIDEAWTAIERGWEIESRSFFEAEAPRNGFGSPLAMAIHYMWKRHPAPANTTT